MTERRPTSPSEKLRLYRAALTDFVSSMLSPRSAELHFTDEEVIVSQKLEQHHTHLEELAKQKVGTYPVVSVRYEKLTNRYRIRALLTVGESAEEVEMVYEVLARNITWTRNPSDPETLTITADHRFFATLVFRDYPDQERIIIARGRRN